MSGELVDSDDLCAERARDEMHMDRAHRSRPGVVLEMRTSDPTPRKVTTVANEVPPLSVRGRQMSCTDCPHEAIGAEGRCDLGHICMRD